MTTRELINRLDAIVRDLSDVALKIRLLEGFGCDVCRDVHGEYSQIKHLESYSSRPLADRLMGYGDDVNSIAKACGGLQLDIREEWIREEGK